MKQTAAGIDKVNILVVDDRPENVLALQGILSNPDYNVVTASTGAEALKKLLKHDFAMILLDVLMPSMDGFETARLISQREASRHIPIIFLTAVGTDFMSMYKGYSVGAVDYLIKPIEPDIVKAKVAVFVDLYQKAQRIQRQEEQLREAERQRSQIALLERESEYEATFDKAAVGIAHASTDGHWLRVNPKFCEIIGHTREQLLRLRLQNVTHPEDVATHVAALHKILAGEQENFRSEQRFIHKNGHSVWVDLTVSLLRDASGHPKKFITVVEDITERKHAQEGQRVLSQASEILLNSFDSNSTMAAVAGCIVPTLADFCVVEVVSDEGKPTENVVAHVDAAEVKRLQDARKAGSFPFGWGIAEVRSTGQALLISEMTDDVLSAWASDPPDLALLQGLGMRSMIVVPLMVRGAFRGAITFISTSPGRRFGAADVAIGRDLAHRAALCLENARLYQQAQDAIGARDEFLSIASHELRTPLTPLQIQLQRLLGTGGKSHFEDIPQEQLRKLIHRSSLQVKRLAALIDSLLDVSRITSGKFSLEMQEVDLAEVAREVVSRFSEAALGAGCTLSLSANAPVPTQCDRLRVEQVLTNLLANAIRYGSGKPIEVHVQSDEGLRRIIVKDQGIGIAADKLPVIFDRFERAGSARAYGGLGLGLYIARQIVDAHRGSIHVVSEPNHGSVFTVELPVASSRTTESETVEEIVQPTTDKGQEWEGRAARYRA